MKSFLNLLLLTFLCSFSVSAQTSGNGGSSPWVVLTSQYPTSPFNDTTEVDVYFDGSSYSGYVTSLQFKVDYDGVTFDSLYSCLLYTSPSPRDRTRSRMPSSA